jgi:spore germination protein GerM
VSGHARSLRRLLAVLVALLGVAAACSIQPDTSPRDIPQGDGAILDPVDPEGGEAAGSTRVFLVNDEDGDPHLRSVLRSVDATPTAVLTELFKGPNDQEDAAGLRTSLPDGLVLNSARVGAGNLVVDVGPAILDLPTPALRLAVAQIVFTASELDGINTVRLRVDGQDRAWPDGQGELQTDPLTTYDYPGLAESSQPPYPPIPSGLPPG